MKCVVTSIHHHISTDCERQEVPFLGLGNGSVLTHFPSIEFKPTNKEINDEICGFNFMMNINKNQQNREKEEEQKENIG